MDFIDWGKGPHGPAAPPAFIRRRRRKERAQLPHLPALFHVSGMPEHGPPAAKLWRKGGLGA